MKADVDLRELRRSLAGDVVVPEDVEYDAARRCFNALVDSRPAVIARCVGPDDVGRAFDPDNVLRRNQNIPPPHAGGCAERRA